MDPASIIALVTAGTKILELAIKARDIARSKAEWSEDKDREFDAKMEAAFKQSHWTV